MFRGLGNMASMLGQLGELKEKAVKMRAELARLRVTGASADGRVSVVADGHMTVHEVTILDGVDADGLDAAVLEATNAALSAGKAAVKERMSELTGGLDLPGLSDLLPG